MIKVIGQPHKKTLTRPTQWSTKRINWTAIAAVVALITSVLTWVISVEVRFAKQSDINSVTQRIENIEQLLTPVLVDWKVKEELKKYGVFHTVPAPMAMPPGEGNPSVEPTPLPTFDKLEDRAKRWADNAVQQRPLEKNNVQ